MPRHEDVGLHLLGPKNCCIEVIDLEPQKHPISGRLKILVADRAMVVINVPAMKLKDQFVVDDQPFVIQSAMSALAV